MIRTEYFARLLTNLIYTMEFIKSSFVIRMAMTNTPVTILIGTAIVAGISGFIIGSTFREKIYSSHSPALLKPGQNFYGSDEEGSKGIENYQEDRNDRTKLRPKWESNRHEEYKMVLVVRTDLAMTKGWFELSFSESHSYLQLIYDS